MGRYLSITDYKSWARNELPTEDDSIIGSAIEAAEQSIDNACHRRFELASTDVDGDPDTAEATARLFRPYANSTLLFIDDCTAVTAISENSSALDDDYWQLEPLNGRSKAGELVPYDSIRCLYRYWFHNGAIPVSVTAVWGWPAIPPQIVEACKVLTKDIIENRDARAGLINLGEAGLAAARMNPTVRLTIADYSLKHSLVA